MKHIGIIGAGGVGGYFGGILAHKLAADPEYRVHFIARGAHLEAIRKQGLHLTTSNEGEFKVRPETATDQIESLPLLDICLICVKAYDLTAVSERLRSVISEETLIIPLLNGVDIYERIRSVTDKGCIFPGCVYVGTHIAKPGHVVQNGGACQILFGKDPAFPDIVPYDLIHLFDRCRINYQWIPDPYPAIWEKYLFITAFGMAGAVHNMTLGQLTADHRAAEDVKSVMKEITLLAEHRQIGLPDGIVEKSFQKAVQFPPETKCSFHRDFEKGARPDERAIFGEAILNMGRQSGLSFPVTERWVRQLAAAKTMNSSIRKDKICRDPKDM